MKINNNKQIGFTLIELMIVVAIIGIISAIAIPSYTEYVRKSKRTDAKVELLRIAQIQESYFVQNLSYANGFGTAAGGLGLGTSVQSEQEVYTMSMTSLNSAGTACNGLTTNACTSYVVTATASGSQTSDTHCGNFTLSNTGVKGISASTTAARVRECWK